MRLSGTASWRVEIGSNPLIDGALWIRERCGGGGPSQLIGPGFPSDHGRIGTIRDRLAPIRP